MATTTWQLHNGRIVARPDAGRQTVTIRDGAITAITAETDRSSWTIGAEHIDVDGRWLLPGLWDHHVHFSQWAIVHDRLDLSAARSAAQVAATVGRAISGPGRTGSPGSPGSTAGKPPVFVGAGYRDALWPDEPSAELLDQHTGGRPVVLISADLHACWLNTAALNRFGHAPSTSGVLREQAAFAVQLAVSDLPPERADALVGAAASAAAARGVVGVVDFDQPDIGVDWQRRIAAGITSLRVICSVWPQRLDAAVARKARTGDTLPGTDGLATMGPLKVIIDGSLNTRTAYCFDPYPDAAGRDEHGLLTVGVDELLGLLQTAARAELTAAVHAIGDHANSVALDAFSRAGHRPGSSIEHAQLLTTADVTRMADLGLVASVQPEHALDDRDVADRYWAGRTQRAFAYRSLLDAGVPLTLGSDAPVAPLDPWVSIAAAAHRTRTERPSWHPEQRITIAQALAASVRGRLEPGAAADLVVVDLDPVVASAEELRAMPVAATMLRGEWTFDTLS